MRAADLGQGRDLRLAVEDVELVAAEEREAATQREAVPELLEQDGSVGAAARTEQIDHLAEDPGRAVREAGRELVEQCATYLQ